MIPLIQQALVWGYTASQILDFVGNKIANVSGGIKNARSRGYSDEDILKYLQGKIKVDKGAAKKQEYLNDQYMRNWGYKTKEERQSDKAKFLKGALGVAGTGLAAYGAYKNYSGLLGQLKNAMGRPTPGPNIPQVPQPGAQAGPQGQLPTAQQPIAGQAAGTPPTTPQPTAPQAGQIQQPQKPVNLGKHNSTQILKDMNLQQTIDQLKETGYDPSVIEATMDLQIQPFQKEWLKKQTGLDVKDVIKDYLEKGPTELSVREKIERMPSGKQTETEPPQVEKAIEKKTGEVKPLEKGSRIITPSGDFGTIEDLPGKTAKIDVDGKKQIIESDEAIPIPDNEEEVLSLYERLIAAIPEDQRSAVLNWVGYDPNRNILQVKFHNGSSYTYENIPPEFAQKIKDVQFLAKTSGENYFGAWAEGEESRGAGVAALIRELQKEYGGKGKEYSAKFEEVYSFLGMPERLLKEKIAKKKQIEKEKKAAEKQANKKNKQL